MSLSTWVGVARARESPGRALCSQGESKVFKARQRSRCSADWWWWWGRAQHPVAPRCRAGWVLALRLAERSAGCHNLGAGLTLGHLQPGAGLREVCPSAPTPQLGAGQASPSCCLAALGGGAWVTVLVEPLSYPPRGALATILYPLGAQPKEHWTGRKPPALGTRTALHRVQGPPRHIQSPEREGPAVTSPGVPMAGVVTRLPWKPEASHPG